MHLDEGREPVKVATEDPDLLDGRLDVHGSLLRTVLRLLQVLLGKCVPFPQVPRPAQRLVGESLIRERLAIVGGCLRELRGMDHHEDLAALNLIAEVHPEIYQLPSSQRGHVHRACDVGRHDAVHVQLIGYGTGLDADNMEVLRVRHLYQSRIRCPLHRDHRGPFLGRLSRASDAGQEH
jgi:hypothetical protein